MGRLFGTDGVRGLANVELTAELALKLGFAAAKVLTGHLRHKAKVVIGQDTRVSCPMIEAALTAGLTSAGADVALAGVLPTPAISYLTKQRGFDLGIMISASHNPYEFNGIKLFSSEGYKLADATEDLIEAEIACYQAQQSLATCPEPGRYYSYPEGRKDYTELMLTKAELDLQGWRLGVDCANGAASQIAVEILQRLGAEVYCIGNTPDGFNINANCGSTDMRALQALVKEKELALGLAFDGDADRFLAVDDKGAILDGDEMLAILAYHMLQTAQLPDRTLVVTVMSNLGLDLMAAKHGLSLKKTKVGDRYVLEEMLGGAHIIGGEPSGHMIFLNDSCTGDGILSALKILAVLSHSKVPMSELRKIMQKLPQVLVNATVSNERKATALQDPVVQAAVAKVEAELAGQGRLLIRPSGTEPYIRIMLEGQDEASISKMAHELAQLIQREV